MAAVEGGQFVPARCQYRVLRRLGLAFSGSAGLLHPVQLLHRCPNGYDDSYFGFLDKLVQKHGATWLLRTQPALPAEFFVDAVHLDGRAAFEFSVQIAGLLPKESLKRAR